MSRRRDRTYGSRSLHEVRDVRSFRAAKRDRDQEEAAKWYFAVSGVNETTILCSGVFTGEARHLFYSKRAIASFRGKLLHLRDVCTPGRRIRAVTVMPAGDAAAVIVSSGLA